MRRFAAFALVVACACTPLQWQKPDFTAEQARADEQECQQAAWREASVRSWHYQTMPSTAMVDPYGYQLMEENRLAQFCMESKGYQLERVPKR